MATAKKKKKAQDTERPWVRRAAWAVGIALFLAWADSTSTAEVQEWVTSRLGLLTGGGAVAAMIAATTKTKADDTFIAGLLGFLGQRFGQRPEGGGK